MKILFFQTVHPESDDRIIHQMLTFSSAGHQCFYSQSRSDHNDADVIICDTPKAILSNVFRSGILIYDVTEWYPSKKNLRSFSIILRPLVAILMVVASFLAGVVADRFIFGEKDKARPFRFFFPWKRFIMLPYFPSQTLFDGVVPEKKRAPLKAIYAGPLTEEKGYFRSVSLAEKANINLHVLGPDDYMELGEFCQFIRQFDVAFDLRDRDAENRHCLPIKLFYYWAAGVIPIYSDLDAISYNVPEVKSAAILVKSEDEALRELLDLKCNPERVAKLKIAGRRLFECHYNWEAIQGRLLTIIG